MYLDGTSLDGTFAPQRAYRVAFVHWTCILLMFAASVATAKAQLVIPTAGPALGERPRNITLPEAVDLAMQHNRSLQVTRLGVASAEQQKDIARSNYYPKVKNESAAFHVTALEGVVIPAGAFASGSGTGLVPSDTVRIGQGAQDTYTSGTGLTQPITQLLRVHAGARAATADVKIAALESVDAENSIALLVHKLYFAILTTQIKLQAANEAVKAGEVTETESKQAVTEGQSLELAQLESHAAWLEKKQASLSAQLAIDDLSCQLNDVLGLPLKTRLELDPQTLSEASLFPPQDEATRIAKEHNPKVLIARQDVEKAKADITAAKDAYIPDITGIARYSYQSGVPLLVHNFGSFGGAVTYELFDGGAREARLRQARINLHIAEVRLAQVESGVSVQISSYYDEIQKIQQLITVVSEGLKVRTEAARVTQERVLQNAALPSEAATAAAKTELATVATLPN